MSERISLTALLAELDKYDETAVMRVVCDLYDSVPRGLFANSFIDSMDLMAMGYKGFKTILMSIYEQDEDFIFARVNELRMVLSMLRNGPNGSQEP